MTNFGKSERIRFAIPLVLLALVVVAFGVRLVMLHLDLVTSKLSTPTYDFNRVTHGVRGSILSCGGIAFAKTTTVWDYHLDARQAAHDPLNPRLPLSNAKRMEKIKAVSQILHLPIEKVMDAYATPTNRPGSAYIFLATSSDDAAYAELANPNNNFRELSITERQVRVYPQGRRLSHVVGFVSKDPTNTVGAAGLEQRYERYLKGTRGQIHGAKDAVGREDRRRRDLDIDARDGCNVYLTIDHNVQLETEKALREGIIEHRAAAAWAIVLSVKTGAVLAMASLPDYDPTDFNHFPAEARLNRAISENYEPGSVMKTITACAALNAGLCGPDTHYNTARNDPNYYRLPGDVGHVWEETMSVRDALVHSSNIVFGKIGFDLRPERLYGYMTQFGLGRLSGIEVPGEQFGILPNWQKWDKVKWSRAPIGQGVAVTAIQLAAAYAAIGNDGELLRPYLVDRVVQADGEVIYKHTKEVVGRPITPAVARSVREMMTGVATKAGTARRAAVPGYTVAGKTGTAQMKEGRGYSSNRFNASFVGIVPATRPEVVILVTFQNPFFCRSRATAEAAHVPIFNHQGGTCAAPTFRKIAEVVLRYLEIEPDVPDEMPEIEDEETTP